MSILGKTKQKILYALSENEGHGYELAQRVKVPITGIYQHLKELARDGLIKSTTINRKKVYRLTEKGVILLQLIQS